MPVIDTPSIWDYIANAGGQAIGSYKEAQDKVRQDAAQNAGLLSQLFGAGAIDASTLQPAISKIPGMGNVKVQPNVAERTRTPGTPENIAQQADVAANKQKLQKADIVQRWSSGQHISEEEAAIAGLPTQQDMQQMKEAKADPILERAGTQYVDQAVLKMGGRLDPAKAIDIAQNAYQQYLKDYQAANLGTLNDAQLKNAQRYFASRAMQILVKQREDDTARINAQRDRSTIQPADRMFSQLTSLMENNRKTMEDFIKTPSGTYAQMNADKPDSQIPPAFKGAVVRYRRLQQRESDLQDAQNQLSMGVIPKNFAGLLGSHVAAGDQPPIDQNKVSTLATRIKANKKLRPQLETGLANGTISQAEYAAVKAAIGEK